MSFIFNEFFFKNKLFVYLREKCWKSSSFLTLSSMLQLKSKTTKLIESNRRFIQSSISFIKFIDYVCRIL